MLFRSNALSYLQVQDGVLEVMGQIVDRMAELRTLAADVSKNSSDVENYSKEFIELQDQLSQMSREKFNGVELFAVEEEWDQMQGVNKDQLFINGGTYASLGTNSSNRAAFDAAHADNTYEYFDDPVEGNRTNTSFDKYEFQLFTSPSGTAVDGNVKLNIVNLQMLLGLKDPSAIDSDLSIATVVGSAPPTLSIAATLNLGGFNQPDLSVGSNDESDKLTNNGTGYIKDITEVSVEEFTNIIEKIADARAENGAEQQRVNQSLQLHQNNLVNLEAAHGRIMDVDVALESTRLARHSVKVQASAAMVAQANQMSAVALSLLTN